MTMRSGLECQEVKKKGTVAPTLTIVTAALLSNSYVSRPVQALHKLEATDTWGFITLFLLVGILNHRVTHPVMAKSEFEY